MTSAAQPAPTDPHQFPRAAPGTSYWLHVGDDGVEHRLARRWPGRSIFVQVRGSEESTVTFAVYSSGEVWVPVPRGLGWEEVWPEQIKRQGTLVLWVRRRA